MENRAMSSFFSDVNQINCLCCSKTGELKTALKNISEFAKPYRIGFEEMVELMNLCGQLPPPTSETGQRTNSISGRALPPIANPVTLLSGILPGKYP